MLIPLSSWLFDMHLNTEAKHCPSPESVLSLCSLLATCFLLWLAWVKLLCELGHLCSLSFFFRSHGLFYLSLSPSLSSCPHDIPIFHPAVNKWISLPSHVTRPFQYGRQAHSTCLLNTFFFFFKKQKPQS